MAASKDFILDDEGQMWSNKLYVRLKMFRNNISYNFTISNNFTDGGNFASGCLLRLCLLIFQDGASLNLSFIPLDIKLTNWDDLPEAFSRRRENRIQVCPSRRAESGYVRVSCVHFDIHECVWVCT